MISEYVVAAVVGLALCDFGGHVAAPECLNDTTLLDAINHCLTVNTSAYSVNGECPISTENPYGPMPDWCMSDVTTLYHAFQNRPYFNGNISMWDTGSVTIMSRTFINAPVFNNAVGGWNTSNVEEMSHMFSGATSFDQPIGGWVTSSVTDMSFMFYAASAFNQNLKSWNVSNVEDMSYMFHDSNMDQDLSCWDVRFSDEYVPISSSLDVGVNVGNMVGSSPAPTDQSDLILPANFADTCWFDPSYRSGPGWTTYGFVNTTLCSTADLASCNPTTTTTTTTTTITTVRTCPAGETLGENNTCVVCPDGQWSNGEFEDTCQAHYACNGPNMHPLFVGTTSSPTFCVVENETYVCPLHYFRHDVVIERILAAPSSHLGNRTRVSYITHSAGPLSNQTHTFIVGAVASRSYGSPLETFNHAAHTELTKENWAHPFVLNVCIESMSCYHLGEITETNLTADADNVCEPCPFFNSMPQSDLCPDREKDGIEGECTFPLYVFSSSYRTTDVCCLGPNRGNVARNGTSAEDDYWWNDGEAIDTDNYTPTHDATGNTCIEASARWSPTSTTTTRTTTITTTRQVDCFNAAREGYDIGRAIHDIASCFGDTFAANYGRDASGARLCVDNGPCDFVCATDGCGSKTLDMSADYDAFFEWHATCVACASATTTQTTSTVTVEETTPASGAKKKLRFTKHDRIIGYIIVSLLSAFAMVGVLAIDRNCSHMHRRWSRKSDLTEEKVSLKDWVSHS